MVGCLHGSARYTGGVNTCSYELELACLDLS